MKRLILRLQSSLYPKDILLVESPLQLINAYEAINSFKLENYIIYIRYSKEKRNDDQIDELIKILNIKPSNIIKIFLSSKNKNFLDYLKIVFYFFHFRFCRINRLFIGNLESNFLSIIYKYVPIDKVIVMDDGSKTIALQEKFNNTNFYNLFTIYDLKKIGSQKIYKNNYNRVKSLIKNICNRTDYVLFIGSNMCEMGIISQENYLSLINKIYKYYNKSIVYIPHRKENEDKLNKIANNKNIIIKKLNYPIELYGIYEKELPSLIASFYSTALLTMKNIYGIHCESFYFDFSKSKYKDVIESVYQYYKKEMRIIYLND